MVLANSLRRSLRLGKGVRLQYEAVTRNHVLLFPEGCVDLNDSATAILSKLPKPLPELRSEILREYGTVEGVDDFVDHAIGRRWIKNVPLP